MARLTSLWSETALPATPRPELSTDLEVDFAIIGGGYSGLWTAYWLKRLEPTASVVLLERETVGFGASGRNGGWFSALFPASMDKLARLSDREAAIAQQRAMNAVVLDTEALLLEEGIEADWQRGGTISLVRTEVQLQRAQAEVQWWRDWGFGESDFKWLDAVEAREQLNASTVLGGTYTPHCARVHPLKLCRGIAQAAERRGVIIYERTAVRSFSPGQIETASGHRVKAKRIVRATEAYTSEFAGLRREIAPVYSLMVATQPLSEDLLEKIGLQSGQTFTDYRHLIIYGQRTADNRIAFGGRGAPYHFNSAISAEFEQHQPTHEAIWQELVELLPALKGQQPEFTWGGPLGIARDWVAEVGVDSDGLASLGGYVGDGLGTSALGGRTLAELLTERTTERTALPWVGHRSRKWEPEPFRWLGVNLGLSGMTLADREERWTQKPSKIAKTFNALLRS